MQEMFGFEPARYRGAFAAQGFVHIRQGVTEEFHRALSKQAEEHLRSDVLGEFALGDKQQGLYEFPPDADYYGQLLDAVVAVCGLAREGLVLSERHIKAYEAGAAPEPLAHKDRFASQVAVGLSIHVPEGSTLVLYPYDHLEVNSYNSSAELRASLAPDRLPEPYLRTARRVEIPDAARDVVMFRGNAIWHHRLSPANTRILYLKLNDRNCDPLGEDPGTARRRALTETALAGTDAELEEMIPLVSRRVDYVDRRYARDWSEAHGVVLWGQTRLAIDEEELRALQHMDGWRSVGEVVRGMNEGGDGASRLARIRRLAAHGAVELLPAPPH